MPGEVLGTGLFDLDRAKAAPGWLKELRGEHVPETEEYGISSFVYRAWRPFHPKRFWDRMNGEWRGVVRSKGFFWLATRYDVAWEWSQAGGACHVRPAGTWWASVPPEQRPPDLEDVQFLNERWREPHGDRRQELVIIGIGLDRQSLCDALDACLLTDAEMSGGPREWIELADPFPKTAKLVGDTQDDELLAATSTNDASI